MSLTSEHSINVQELLEDLDLFRLPVVPKEICQKLDIEYREYRYEGIEGTLLVIGTHQLIGVNANTKEPTRKAFTCAHELGHYYYDLDEGKTSFTCSTNDIVYHGARDRRELRANEFAAELLMPRALIEPMIHESEPSWELISDIADECGTSLQATAQRYVQLSPHDCWFAVLNDGKIRRYHKSERTPLHLKTKQTFIVPRGASQQWQTVSARSWMGSSETTPQHQLLQSFLRKNQYGDTLALLWDNPDLIARHKREVRAAKFERAINIFFKILWTLFLGWIVAVAKNKPRPRRRYY